MRKRTGAAAFFALCLSLGALLAGEPGSHPELDVIAQKDTPVTVVFKETDIRIVLQAIERLTDKLHFVYYKDFRTEKISCDFEQVPLKEALVRLADDHGLTYKQHKPDDPNVFVVQNAVAKP